MKENILSMSSDWEQKYLLKIISFLRLGNNDTQNLLDCKNNLSINYKYVTEILKRNKSFFNVSSNGEVNFKPQDLKIKLTKNGLDYFYNNAKY